MIKNKSTRKHRFFIWSSLVVLGALIIPLEAHSAGDVSLYGFYEEAIDYQALKGSPHSYPDPFYGVELNATFTSPTGKQIAWWGFYDGDGQGSQSGNIWKIRFMPDELGAWNFTWEFSDLSLSGSGFFQSVDNATNPRKPGPLKHDPTINQWLMTADGSRHVFLNMYLKDSDGGTDPNYYRFVNDAYDSPGSVITDLKAKSFDVLWTEGSTHWANLGRPKNDPNNPYPFMDTTNYIPRLQGWHYMEKGLFQEVYNQEVYLFEFLGFYAGNGLYDLHTRSISFQNKVLKYWLAREAPYYFFIFNIGFELQEFVAVPSWPVSRATWIKGIDPWNHLITGHEGVGFWSYGNDPIMDFSTLQELDYNNYHNIALAVWNSAAKPHGHMNEGLWTGPWGQPSGDDHSRILQWELITGGMSYALILIQNDNGLMGSTYANGFLKNGVKWWTMSPHDEVVTAGTAYVLAKLGVEYIAFSSSGSAFSMSLPAGSYNSRWFNPADGTYSGWTPLNTSGGSNAFTKPDSNDWVLSISNLGSDTTPPAIPTGVSTN